MIKAQRGVVGQFQEKSALKIIFNYILYTILENCVSHWAMSPACDVILKGKYWGQLMFIQLQTCSDTFSAGDNFPQ